MRSSSIFMLNVQDIKNATLSFFALKKVQKMEVGRACRSHNIKLASEMELFFDFKISKLPFSKSTFIWFNLFSNR